MSQCEWPQSEAIQHLRGDEVFAICKHFAVKDVTDAGGIQLLVGTVWAYENRREPTSFAAVAKWVVADLVAYFAPEPVEPEDEMSLKSGGPEGK